MAALSNSAFKPPEMTQSFDASLRDLQRFYAILDHLEAKNGGALRLEQYKQSNLRHARGVYFFFQDGENRTYSGRGRRVVRVGMHGGKAGGKSTARKRMSQHWGLVNGGGNHRISAFRLHVGAALMKAGLVDTVCGWGNRKPLDLPAQRKTEQAVEAEVSRVIRSMSILWLEINDVLGKESEPASLEKSAIALLTTVDAKKLDPPSRAWLGHYSANENVQTSGLWNDKHVEGVVDSTFLDELEGMVQRLKLPGQPS